MASKVFLFTVAYLIMDQRQLTTANPMLITNFPAIRFYYYNAVLQSPVLISGHADASMLMSRNRDTVVIVHGHQEGALLPSDSSAPNIRAAFLERARSDRYIDFDIIVVDWSMFSSMPYSSAITMIPTVSQKLITLLNELLLRRLVVPDTLHLVGFDLGAHIVGLTGRNLNQLPARITGLDPNAEGFSNINNNSWRLTANDAAYVEVIHTDAFGSRAIGISEAIGTADYYPNGGTRQPGCGSDNECNHKRAYELFDATVTNRRPSIANQCRFMSHVTNNRCNGATQSLGGHNVLVKRRSGLFRINTSSSYPYTTNRLDASLETGDQEKEIE